MARPTKSTRVRKIAAHNGATNVVAATTYDDDNFPGTLTLDKAILNDNSPTASGSDLSVTGKTWTNVGGEWKWI